MMKKHILIVDDDAREMYALARVLATRGYETHTARDYLSALRELERQPMDLLVTDVVMPKGMNGFALARMAQMRQRNLKVLYVTGYDVPTTEATAKVLRKPVTDHLLVDEVERALAA